MKLNIIRIILGLLLLQTFFIIFGFSSQNGEESSSVSKRVSEAIVDFTNKNIKKEDKDKLIEHIEPVIRKLAHFSIYMVVGLLLMALASTYGLSFKRKLIICLVVGALYASSDEIHQLFVSERSGQITDVFIDTAGVVVGSLISNKICSFLKFGYNSQSIITKSNEI